MLADPAFSHKRPICKKPCNSAKTPDISIKEHTNMYFMSARVSSMNNPPSCMGGMRMGSRGYFRCTNSTSLPDQKEHRTSFTPHPPHPPHPLIRPLAFWDA